MELVIGPKAYSTWSLRPWLVLKRCGASFSERVIDLYGPASDAELAAASPSRKVPVLNVEGETIWDSLAISVWAAERWPGAGLWPEDARARWLARSATCEMHSAFMALRTECGMGPDHLMVGAPKPLGQVSDALAADVRRLVELWRGMRSRFGAGGPYLFGAWSVPDAFFTPVACRVRHYALDLARFGDDDGVARAYCETLLAQPDFLEWERDALG